MCVGGGGGGLTFLLHIGIITVIQQRLHSHQYAVNYFCDCAVFFLFLHSICTSLRVVFDLAVMFVGHVYLVHTADCTVVPFALLLIQKRLKENIRRRVQQQEARYQETVSKIHSEKDYTDAISDFVQQHEQREIRKHQQLYQEWNQEIFEPIQVLDFQAVDSILCLNLVFHSRFVYSVSPFVCMCVCVCVCWFTHVSIPS